MPTSRCVFNVGKWGAAAAYVLVVLWRVPCRKKWVCESFVMPSPRPLPDAPHLSPLYWISRRQRRPPPRRRRAGTPMSFREGLAFVWASWFALCLFVYSISINHEDASVISCGYPPTLANAVCRMHAFGLRLERVYPLLFVDMLRFHMHSMIRSCLVVSTTIDAATGQPGSHPTHEIKLLVAELLCRPGMILTGAIELVAGSSYHQPWHRCRELLDGQ